jgi:hypothetical protein
VDGTELGSDGSDGFGTCGVLAGGVPTGGVLTGGVLTGGVLTGGVLTEPTLTGGTVTEGTVTDGVLTFGTLVLGTFTDGTPSAWLARGCTQNNTSRAQARNALRTNGRQGGLRHRADRAPRRLNHHPLPFMLLHYLPNLQEHQSHHEPRRVQSNEPWRPAPARNRSSPACTSPRERIP